MAVKPDPEIDEYNPNDPGPCPVCGNKLKMLCYYPVCCGLCDDVRAGRKTKEQADARRTQNSAD